MEPTIPERTATARSRTARWRHRWLPLLSLLVAAPAAAQVTPRTPPLPPSPDAAMRMIRLGLTQVPLLVPLDFRLPSIEDDLFARVRFRDWVDEWSAGVSERLAQQRDSLRLARRFARTDSSPPADTVPYLPPLVPPDTAVAGDALT
ncbi:MAG: hypothetical protein ACRELX_02060, partial [Longimicrobiales bacterium]